MLLTHNSSIAFLISAAASIFWFGRGFFRTRMLISAAAVTPPLIIWIGVRYSLGQLGSHPLGFGTAPFHP